MMNNKIDINLESFLFSNCIPVKGASRSILYDLQREHFTYIPNDLFDIIETGTIKPIGELLDIYGEENKAVLEEYLELLISEEYIHQEGNNEMFPRINEFIDEPFFLQDSIIDVDENSNHDFNKIFNELENLLCQHIEIRFFGKFGFEKFKEVTDLTKDKAFRSVSILCKYSEGFSVNEYYEFLNDNFRIRELIVYGSPSGLESENEDNRIKFIDENITDPSLCGNICKSNFRVSLPMYLASKKTNNCLNKKVSVDVFGNIKNCPSMDNSFGNINEVSFESVLMNEKFKELWDINKDQIDICKVCEYRYMCSDCRVFISDKEDRYSKPSKCKYDPYTMVFEK